MLKGEFACSPCRGTCGHLLCCSCPKVTEPMCYHCPQLPMKVGLENNTYSNFSCSLEKLPYSYYYLLLLLLLLTIVCARVSSCAKVKVWGSEKFLESVLSSHSFYVFPLLNPHHQAGMAKPLTLSHLTTFLVLNTLASLSPSSFERTERER